MNAPRKEGAGPWAGAVGTVTKKWQKTKDKVALLVELVRKADEEVKEGVRTKAKVPLKLSLVSGATSSM